jgi:hypothetical protein
MPDPKLIASKHNGKFTRGGVTVEVRICRLEDTKWTLEVVDESGASIVWDGEFDTDDAAHAEFQSYAGRGIGLDMPPSEVCRTGLERGSTRTVCKAACEDRPKIYSA